ncbi:MAG: ABC transporter ATP-binding protein/permease [Tenericutes bacterium]|nr:ABC transporter ATP-binding protein/permease [Mycoplasmatota bacterium]
MKKNIILSFIFSIIEVISKTIIPIITGLIIDSLLENKFTNILYLILINVLLIIIASIYNYLLNVSAKMAAIEYSNEIKEKVLKRLLKLKINVIEKYKSGLLASKIVNDVNNIHHGLITFLTHFIPGIVTLILTLIIMFFINFKITLIIFLITPISVFITIYIAKQNKKLTDISNKEYNDMTSYIKEQIELKKYINVEKLENQKEQKINDLSEKYMKDESKALFYASISNPTTRLINGIITIIVVLYSSFEIMNGNMTIGIFSTFLIYANRYAKPLNEISQVINRLTISLTSYDSIKELITEEIEEFINSNDEIIGNIEFKNVSFSYNNDKEILKNINFKINNGEKIAIVGPTGSGKTTIIQLLLKFYNINSGSILIDGKNINDINTNILRDNIKVVLQDAHLNNENIKDVLKYSNDVSDKEIKDLLKRINIKPNFLGMNEKLENITSIDNLSNGQKQIISMIRAMLSNPKIVILDEATSDVDSLTEKNIESSINELTKGKTSIIIAHRLSTIISADKIIVIDNGKVLEEGTHKELINKNGLYKKIYESQF